MTAMLLHGDIFPAGESSSTRDFNTTSPAAQIGNTSDSEDLSPEPAETAQYHQTIRITLEPMLHSSKRRVFVIYRSKLIAASANFRAAHDTGDLHDMELSDIHARTFELFFHWLNTGELTHTHTKDNRNHATLLDLADLWGLGERFEAARLQDQIMDRLCMLHNEKRLDAGEFVGFVEFLNRVVLEQDHLARFLKLVLHKYPAWEFFSELLKNETPRRRWMCLNLLWGDGWGRKEWKICPQAHRLYVGEHIEDEENLIEL